MPAKLGLQSLGQDGVAILVPLTFADQDLPLPEVEILHAQAQTFPQAQAAAPLGLRYG